MSGSVTHWIDCLKAGDPSAAQPLWERYFEEMVRLARARLRHAGRRVADEEDAASVAFASFCEGAAQGRFPLLKDRDNLWPLLIRLTEHKVVDQVRRERAERRGGGRVRGETDLGSADRTVSGGDGFDLNAAPADIHSPEFPVHLADTFEHLFGRLPDQIMKQVALRHLEGFTNQEIASLLDVGLRTVERKLGLIRRIWQLDDDTSG